MAFYPTSSFSPFAVGYCHAIGTAILDSHSRIRHRGGLAADVPQPSTGTGRYGEHQDRRLAGGGNASRDHGGFSRTGWQASRPLLGAFTVEYLTGRSAGSVSAGIETPLNCASSAASGECSVDNESTIRSAVLLLQVLQLLRSLRHGMSEISLLREVSVLAGARI
jgi:hypothetical protein